jgi:hypothetical protein
MLRRVVTHIRRQPVAFVALFFALGGGAIAANTYIRSTDTISEGDLAGSTYGKPVIASGAVTDTKVAAANKDGTAATPSLRTLGTGAQQAAAGNDPRLSDARTPTGAASGDLTGTYPNPSVADGAITPAKLNAGLTFTDALTVSDDCLGIPAFGWYTFSNQPFGYARDSFGIVHLRGWVHNCSASSGLAFNLPAGFRPEHAENFAGVGSSASGFTDIEILPATSTPNSGGIFPNVASPGAASLSGITFRCAPSGQDGCP